MGNKQPQNAKTTFKRRKRGFERTSSLLATRIRQTGETRGFSVSRVLTHWSEVVGEDLAKIAKPVDVSYAKSGFGATLSVLTRGANAPILEMRKEEIRNKVNSAYGYNAVARIRITQTAPTGFAEGQVAFGAAPKPKAPEVTPVELAEIKETAAPISDPKLRKALEMLGQNVITHENRKANT